MARNYSTSIPAPTGGLNTRDALEDMSPDDAISLVNLFPDSGRVKLRGGTQLFYSDSNPSQTMVEYVGVDGTRKLLAARGGEIVDITTGTSSILGGGFSSNKFQTVHFRNSAGTFLYFCNGVDAPVYYNGSTLTVATFSGTPSPAVTTFIQPSAFKNRLYFVSVNSTVVSYLDVNAIQGTINTFDFGPLLKRGGNVMFAGSLTHDRGTALEDAFIVVSSEGEILLYSGSSPLDWVISGRYFGPKPMGRRGLIPSDSDIVVISENGPVPLTAVIAIGGFQEDSTQFKLKIRPTFREAAKNYRDNFGWEGIHYPRGSRVIFNIPTSSTTSEQYVMNAETKAWCKFTGMNAVTWCTFNSELYFSTADGKVFKADTGLSDNGNYIDIDMALAFNYLKDRGTIKLFTLVRPMLETTGPVNFLLNTNVDFQNLPIEGDVDVVAPSEGGQWNVGEWGTAEWGIENTYASEWYAVTGIGRSVSIRIKGRVKDVSFSFDAFSIVYEKGGFI